MQKITRWINTFLPHTVTWYHSDGKSQKFTNNQIHYIGFDRQSFVLKKKKNNRFRKFLNRVTK